MSAKATFDVKCPHCGQEWELDQEESEKPEFTCGSCNRAFNVEQARILKSEPEYPPTRLREILNVVIRIFAIYLGLSLFTFLLQVLAGLHNHASSVSDLLLIGLFVVFTLWLWYLSPLIARKLTWARDSTLDCGQLTLGDLYCFAFLLVGLYFAVDSFGPSLTWLHYTLSQSSSDAGLSRQQQGNYYTLFKYLVRLMLGIGLILNGRKFATRLIKHQNEAGC